jgi:hypothetical protein
MNAEKKPYISLVLDCHVNDEYSEGPSFVVLQIDEDDLNIIKGYRDGIAAMKANGLDPFKVSTFSHNAMFLDPCDADPLNETEQKSMRFLSESDKNEWESRFTPIDEAYVPLEDGNDEIETSTLYNLESDYAVDADMMNITADSMSISGYLKHTGITVTSSVLYSEDYKRIENWIKEL